MNIPAAGSVHVHHASDCQHTELVRLHDDYESQKCSVCDQKPPYGGLYRCNTDNDQLVTEPELTDLENEMRKYNIGKDEDTKDKAAEVVANNSNRKYIPAPASHRDNFSYAHSAIGRRRQTTISGCKFKVCHACRILHHDGVWQSKSDPLDYVNSSIAALEEEIYRTTGAHVLSDVNQNYSSRFYEQLPEYLIQHSRTPSLSVHSDEDEDNKYKEKLEVLDAENSAHSRETLVKRREQEITTTQHIRTPVRSQYVALSEYPYFAAVGAPNLRDSGGSTDNSSSGRGRYYKEETIKEMLREQHEKEKPIDLDEESREKRAGRRLSKGRFFID